MLVERVGSNFSRHRACALERPGADRSDEAGFAAERLVDRVRRDAGVVRDGRDGRRSVTVS